LCQRRSFKKELNPGFWESFFGGHLGPGESYIDGAQRELHEETGITLPTSAFTLWQVYMFHHATGYNNEFQAIFIVDWSGDAADIDFDTQEVERVAWKEPAEIIQALQNHESTGWTFCGYELALLGELIHKDA